MTKLEILFREYEDSRWSKNEVEDRFIFDTEKDRAIFVQELDKLGAKYFLYDGHWGPTANGKENHLYKVDVLHPKLYRRKP